VEPRLYPHPEAIA